MKKKKKADRDPDSTIAKYMAAHGCFFGALARASKPHRKVFLRKGMKKTEFSLGKINITYIFALANGKNIWRKRPTKP